MPAGRPSECTEEMVAKARAYVDDCPDILPSIEGLSLVLGKPRQTLYNWAVSDKHPEFFDVFERLKALQAKKLIENGLTGEYNSTITKVILTKHGYHDKVEQNVKGGITVTVSDKDAEL